MNGVTGSPDITTTLDIPSNTTLSGGGTVTLVSAYPGWAYLTIEDNATLDNMDNTIQGSGVIQISNTNGTLINELGGTIFATGSSGLLITGGTVTNLGTMHVDSDSYLWLNAYGGSGGALTNFSGNTLTGGTYIVDAGGTLKINSLGTTGGEIVNNAATITLNGPGSNILDAQGQDALSNLGSNTAAGSLTITGGRNLKTPSDFSNSGAVTVGAGSTFTTGSSAGSNFSQSGPGASLVVDGVLATALATINGGTVSGGGTIQGNLRNAGGFVHPVSAGAPSKLSVTGDFTQDSSGTLVIDILGTGYGQWSVLSVTGSASLDGTVDFNFLYGFTPAVGDAFTYLTTGLGILGDFANVEFNGYTPSSYSDDNGTLEITQATPTPLPGSILLLAGGLAGLGAYVRRKKIGLR